MRLIDADAYLERMKKDPLFNLIEQYGFSGTLLAEPTVEAIPIDWIADWLPYNQKRIDDGENADDSVEWMLRAWFLEKDIEKERKKRRQRNEIN